ncbi:hypothetical protein Hanom_Chr01g00007651 [Helianthus anomalus]
MLHHHHHLYLELKHKTHICIYSFPNFLPKISKASKLLFLESFFKDPQLSIFFVNILIFYIKKKTFFVHFGLLY